MPESEDPLSAAKEGLENAERYHQECLRRYNSAESELGLEDDSSDPATHMRVGFREHNFREAEGDLREATELLGIARCNYQNLAGIKRDPNEIRTVVIYEKTGLPVGYEPGISSGNYLAIQTKTRPPFLLGVYSAREVPVELEFDPDVLVLTDRLVARLFSFEEGRKEDCRDFW